MQIVTLMSLWLPILISAVVVFFASSIIWMLIKWHNADWSKLPNEDEVRAALRSVPPGEYMLPYAMTNAERAADEFKAKCENGPMGMLTIVPAGLPRMGRQLGIWLVYCLLISLFVGYVLATTLPAGVEYLKVFQVAGTVAFMAYAGATIPGSIWFGHAWGRTAKDVMDGLVYGLLTGGVFGWLWP